MYNIYKDLTFSRTFFLAYSKNNKIFKYILTLSKTFIDVLNFQLFLVFFRFMFIHFFPSQNLENVKQGSSVLINCFHIKHF